MRPHPRRFSQAVALAATLVGVSRAHAQTYSTAPAKPTSQSVGRILGIFDESGQPLEGADVVDRIGGGTMRTTRTGLVGMAVMSSQHDSAVVTIRKIGFADTTVLVMVGARDTVPMQVFLRHATTLDGVTITATESTHLPFYLRDFEERFNDVKITGAKTFTPAEFRKMDGLRVFDLLLLKGVGNKTQHCGRMLIYLDGVPWTPNDVARGSADVPDEDADHYDAAIYYTQSQMPAELMHTAQAPTITRERSGPAPSGCGALLLYSRHKV